GETLDRFGGVEVRQLADGIRGDGVDDAFGGALALQGKELGYAGTGDDDLFDRAVRGTERNVELDLSRFGDLHGRRCGLESSGAHLHRIPAGGEAAHTVASVAVGLSAPVRPGDGHGRSRDIPAELRVADRSGDIAGAGNRYRERGRKKEKDGGSFQCTTGGAGPLQCLLAGKHCYPLVQAPGAGGDSQVAPELVLPKTGSAADCPMIERYCNACDTASGFSSGVPSARLGDQVC